MNIFAHKYRQNRGNQAGSITLVSGDAITVPSGATLTVAGTLTLSGTGVLTSPVLTTPQINDTSLDHQYIITPSELAADRVVTLPLLTGADEFTFNAHTQTLTNKTLTQPGITDLSEVVTTTNVIGASESGKTFYLNAAGGFTSTLPAPALGLNFKFVVKTAPTTAYIITTDGGANVLYGKIVERAGGAGVAGAAQDTFNFVANQAIISDFVEVQSDGTNWYLFGMVDVSAGGTFAVT